jgi:hypothetical protein
MQRIRPPMQSKRCWDCGRLKTLDLFDIDNRRSDRRSSQCQACRRQRQTRGGYGSCRSRALGALARRFPVEYARCRQQARAELAAVHGGARPSGKRMHGRISSRAYTLLQQARPDAYRQLYAAERERFSNPASRPGPP